MSPQEQPMLAFPTDTASPVTPVPIFYMHEGDHPFCLTPACICHTNEAHMRSLLGGVLEGALKLRKAYNGVLVGKGIR
jgi:hypothetical protein